ncbi:hypothetical protein Bca52824_017215 [Brassica carinata]|uniref:Uncharacterized protein n=1 Tax=Brassica carinata TaxID=52824 RepID=A0A8X8AX69_BRACI|nr:hypothetical protein Bca52824_017215 [Brassica carinata]
MKSNDKSTVSSDPILKKSSGKLIYEKLPKDIASLDHVLASGNSAVNALSLLISKGIETYIVERICGINAGDDESASNGAVDVIESNTIESIPNFRVSLMKVVVERWRSGGRVMVSYGGDGRVKSQGGGVVTAWLVVWLKENTDQSSREKEKE